MRRIGVLVSSLGADDPEWQARGATFVQGLQELGWSVGRNVRIDYRFGLGDAGRLRRSAAELVTLAPGIILAGGTGALVALHEATRTLPIVFANVQDPVAAGFAASLARPGGTATGFMTAEYSVSGKWLELLKQIAPRVTRAGVLRRLSNSGIGQFAAIQSVALSFGVDVSPLGVRDLVEIESDVTAFARAPNGGLIIPAAMGTRADQLDLIITLAARHKLPAVYFTRAFVTNGGLISYGPDLNDLYRLAAGYVDRILKGEKPADLPVQQPTKYETVLNLKTAKALGLLVPDAVLVRADEVIE
jgi:putative tryptophan/tyrosine transport system substrate-binding protein